MMRVAIVTVGDPERVSGGFNYQRQLRDLAPAHGATVTFTSIPPGPALARMARGRRILRVAAAEADVVVIDSLAAGVLGPWISRVRARPLVGSVHQRVGAGPGGRLGRRLRAGSDRRVWRACAALVVPSEHLARQLAAAGVRGPTVVVVEPGIEPPMGAAAAAPGVTSGGVDVLCVANWLPAKGIVELIDAVAALEDPDVRLHLVGDEHAGGRYRERVLDRLDRLAARTTVVRHGLVSPDEIARCYAGADLFALASREESYGMVYAEAQAAGLPIVSWDAGNVVNLVTDGVDGRLVPFGDVDALTAALREVVAAPGRRAAMAAAARRRAATRPTWDDTAAGFFAVCRSALTGRS